MSGSTISNLITISVTLGSNAYPNPLTVTPTGDIAPSPAGTYGATGLIATIAAGSVLNQGRIGGSGGTVSSAGTISGNGGIGVVLATGTLANTGGISGGYGGYNSYNPAIGGGSGGAGLIASSSSLSNDGTIAGGQAISPPFGPIGGAGGSGAGLTDSTLANAGLIAGGAGAKSNASSAVRGNGGVGIDAAGSSLTNTGSITGGRAGDNEGGSSLVGGIGASLTVGSTLTNLGRITGGDSTGSLSVPLGQSSTSSAGVGGAGVSVVGSSLTNEATIAGGAGDMSYLGLTGVGAMGGVGVDVTDGSVTNHGTIAGGHGGNAAHLGLGGGGGWGVVLSGSTLTNTGEITGGSAGYQPGIGGEFFTMGGYGVDAVNSQVTNTGTIVAGYGGYLSNGVVLTSSILSNDGTISGGRMPGSGVTFGGPGVRASASKVINNGVITGTYGAEYPGAGIIVSYSTVTNAGTITGVTGSEGGVGADVTGGSLVNTGTIIGGSNTSSYFAQAADGVLFHTAGMLTNAGTIIAGANSSGTIADAVDFGTGAARLIVDPGAVFVGNVVGGTTPSTLELASAASRGTISGLGSSFSGFGTITVDAQATWTATGSVTALGTIGLGAGADLLLENGVAASAPVRFTAASGTLGLADPTDFAATVLGLQAGDAIDFTTITSPGSLSAGVDPSNALTLSSNGSVLSAIQLDPAQDFSNLRFSALPDGTGGTTVTAEPICFLAGTLIATPTGEAPVERLRVGETVLTASGAVHPIVWIGTGRVLATRGRRGAATPVIVRKGALSDNVPHSDLRVTKAHALSVDGVLIPVEFLVNHRSILWDDQAQEVALHHVELETHDVLVANGAPAESYRDDGNRWLFHNANSGWGLPPKPPCAPVLTGGSVVDAAWLRLLERAGRRPGVPLTDEPDLHLLVDGARVDAVSRRGGFHVFRLEAGPGVVSPLEAWPSQPGSSGDWSQAVGSSGIGSPEAQISGTQPPAGSPTMPQSQVQPRMVRPLAMGPLVRIASRSAAPQELGLARDPRLLGVALRRIIIRQGARSRRVSADDPRLADGFHGFESDNGWRWTDGDAVLPASLFAGFEGPLEVVLHCAGATRYAAGSARRRVA